MILEHVVKVQPCMDISHITYSTFFAEEVEIKFSGDKAWLENKEYGTQPLVAHGNGPSKVI